MNHLQDTSISSLSLDMHIQPRFDYVQNLELYRKLVDNVLVPNSNINATSFQPPNTLHTPRIMGLEARGYPNSLQLGASDMSSSSNETNFFNGIGVSNVDLSGEGSQTSDYGSIFQGAEPWSPRSPEADFQLSRGLYHPTSRSSGTESSHTPETVFNFMETDKKSKDERKLARRRERNRTSQRAFRARKEKYTQDLERHYIDLRQRYETLVVLVRSVTGCEPESYLMQHHTNNKIMITQKDLDT